MRGWTGCRTGHLQMGLEEMWGFNRQTIELLQILLPQVIFIASLETDGVGQRLLTGSFYAPRRPESGEKV